MEKPIPLTHLIAALNKKASNGETYRGQVFPFLVWGNRAGVGIAIQKGKLRHAVRFHIRDASDEDVRMSKEQMLDARTMLVDWLLEKEASLAEAKD